MASHILFNVQPNRGYSAEQVVRDTVTLGALLEAIQEQIERHGEDTPVVLHTGMDTAAYGVISPWDDMFETENEEEEVDEFRY